MGHALEGLRLRLLVAAAVSAALAGCTLVGAGIGSLIDKGNGKGRPPDTLAGWRIAEVGRGADVTLSLDDGRQVAGRFDGLEQTPVSAYRARYDRAKGTLPRLGPGALLRLSNGDSETGELVGLDVGAIWLSDGGALHRRELEKAQELRDGAGGTFEAAALDRLTTSLDVPLLSEVILVSDGQRMRMPVDEVLQVQVVRRGHATLIGALVGAAIDTTLVVLALGGSSSDGSYVAPSDDYGGGGSCPLVASYDGSRWQLDSETFGGAIFRAAQRTDWDNLDHLREAGGGYRLQVTNGAPETQYVDELRLLVVDHPRGTRVVPDFDGGLHLLRGASHALVARDLDGHDVAPLVAEADASPWLSSPFGRDPGDPSRVRAGLELAFARPPGVGRADLLVRARNTPFGEWLQKELLELPGTALEGWYAELDRSAEARARLQRAMVREGMLRVEVRARDGWRERGFVWEVGPLVWKELVVPLDVSDVEGDRVQVRLSSTAGLWLVDAVSLEPGSVLVEPATELRATSARDELGRDVLPLLLAADGSTYEMPERKNRAELRFAAPPRAVGLDRSVILESTGYYRIHSSPTGAPRFALMEQLVNEPGAYGRFALGLLQEARRARAAAD